MNIVVSKMLPKTPNVSNMIHKIYHKKKSYGKKKNWDFVIRFNKHLNSKKLEFSGYFFMCQA